MLSSFHANTPTPPHWPTFSQEIRAQWDLSPSQTLPLTLTLKIRFANNEFETVQTCVNASRGSYIYRLSQERYCETGGVTAYIAWMHAGEQCVAEWRHALWRDPIELNPPR